MNKRDELLLDLLETLCLGCNAKAVRDVRAFRSHLEAESRPAACPCQHDDRPKDVFCRCVDGCRRNAECSSPEHQPSAPTSGAGEAGVTRLEVRNDPVTGEPLFFSCAPAQPPPQRDGADDAELTSAMRTMRYWRNRAQLAEKYSALHKALTKRYRALATAYPIARDLFLGVRKERAHWLEQCRKVTADYHRLRAELADLRRAHSHNFQVLIKAENELADLRRAAPDVTAAIEAERARCLNVVRREWSSVDGTGADDADVQCGLMCRRIINSITRHPSASAQPAPVGERKLADGWCLLAADSTFARCDTCKQRKEIAYWKTGAYACCADCVERAGVFATDSPAPTPPPGPVRMGHSIRCARVLTPVAACDCGGGWPLRPASKEGT